MKRWFHATNKTLAIEIQPHRGALGHRWILSFADSELIVGEETVSEKSGTREGAIGRDEEGAFDRDSDAVLTGSAATWRALLTGLANMATELRAGRLRLARPAPGMPAIGAPSLPEEIHLIGRLLGLAGGENSEEIWLGGAVSLNT